MIKAAVVKNRKSHKHTRLDFCPGLNIIFGRSQAGKSAFLEAAFKWLRANRPLGMAKLAWFTKSDEAMSASVVLPEGTITLAKRKGKAKYTVTFNRRSAIFEEGTRNQERSFTAIRTGVPTLVRKLLNMDELNVRGPLDSYYMILASAPDVARAINNVTGLRALDPALNFIATHIKERKVAIRELELKLAECREELSVYKDLDSTIAKLDRAAVLSRRIRRISDYGVNLRDIVERAKTIRASLGGLDSIDFAKCSNLIKSADSIVLELLDVSALNRGLVHAIENATSRYRDVIDAEERFDKARVALSEFKVCPICSSYLGDKFFVGG